MITAKETRPCRRHKLLTLQALKDGQNIARLVTEARGRYSVAAAEHTSDERSQAVTDKARIEADAVTELMLIGVPQSVTALQVVEAIMIKLHALCLVSQPEVPVLRHSGNPAVSAVLRCELQSAFRGDTLRAYVSLRTSKLAKVLIETSRLDVSGTSVKVLKSSRRISVPGAGPAWRTRGDPGSMRWKIGNLQVGEKLTEHVFLHFWTAAPFFDTSRNSYVEINTVSRVLVITVGHLQTMWKALPGLEGFTTLKAAMRIEISLQSISADPYTEAASSAAGHRAICIPISRPPLLYRSGASTSHSRNCSVWDCVGGSCEDVFWVRTVDPTSNKAFSRARGIRILLGRRDMYSLYEHMHRLCVVTISRPTTVYGNSQKEKAAPDRVTLFRKAAEDYKIPFPVRYMVDCILSVGIVREADLSCRFWAALSDDISEEGALAALEWMLFRLSGANVVGKAVDPLHMLLECISMLNLRDDSRSPMKGSGSQNRKEKNNGQYDALAEIDSQGAPTDAAQLHSHTSGILNDLNASGPPLANALHDCTHGEDLTQETKTRRLICTPTAIISLKPEGDTLNRVLREFSEHRDRFLRVTFSDENGSSISFVSSEDLYTRIRLALRDGVHCAGEKFVFLAFSSSQLRDHSVWMYNETPVPGNRPPSADDIRAWMGDFSRVRVPAKFAARQGQTFSSTVGTVFIDESEQVIVDDLHDDDEKYAFSDGVGVISSELGRSVMRKLGMRVGERTPSAFQVRIGGAKGMLSVWDDGLPQNCNSQIALRPSMIKFVSNHNALEIVSCSKRLPLFLNRQIIMVLSGMGVPDRPFEEMQASLLGRLDRAMDMDGGATALNLLETSGCGDSDHKLRSNAPMTNAALFFRAGLTCVNCEHLRNVMNAFRLRTIHDLMKRARIPIDSDKGVCALGIMDELGVLAPEEVFCQFKEPGSGNILLVEGRVTVGRNPSLHPGDIRPLIAVDHPSLRHLVNVIVFPQKGYRPVPSMLSGGDLDGDVFFCIFDRRIEFPPCDPYPPMDYTAPEPREVERVTTSDVADFFVDFLRHDKLGQIATAHVVHADREVEGIFSAKCLRLATLHSTAVDFAKSGIPANFPRDLHPMNKPNQYPDFLGRHPKVSYRSQKVLGKLYRACLESRGGRGERRIQFPNPESSTVDAIIDSFPTNKEFAEEAESLCEAYNVELVRIMEQYGVQSEGELISGQVLSFSARHAQLRGKREYHTLATRLNRQATELRSHFRDLFFNGLGQESSLEFNADTILKACEWHRACRRQARADVEHGNTPLLSFPWVVSEILLNVLREELKGP